MRFQNEVSSQCRDLELMVPGSRDAGWVTAVAEYVVLRERAFRADSHLEREFLEEAIGQCASEKDRLLEAA